MSQPSKEEIRRLFADISNNLPIGNSMLKAFYLAAYAKEREDQKEKDARIAEDLLNCVGSYASAARQIASTIRNQP